jgi:hypothetical protein
MPDLLVIDLTSGLPGFWTWTEGPSLIVFYGLLLWLAARIRSRDKAKSFTDPNP